MAVAELSRVLEQVEGDYNNYINSKPLVAFCHVEQLNKTDL